MNPIRTSLLGVAALLWLGMAAASAQIDPFYLDLERTAAAAAARGEAEQAARLYRIACFGMLDEPSRVAACTVRLAISQAEAGDEEGFGQSFGRLATIEARFQGLTLADLSAEERSEFARRAAAWLPEETLTSIPSVAELARAVKAPAATVSSPSRRKNRGESSAPKPAPSPLVKDSIEPESTGQAPVPETDGAAPAAESEVLSEAERVEIAAAREMLAGRPNREAILASIDSVRAIADRQPEAPEIARLVGDLAYRLADWPLCADYYGRAGDPGPEAPLERFYMAVCLYETGQREAATALLAPSAEQLKRSPFVESYLAKILAPSGLP